MAYSFVYHVGDGVTTNFSVPFSFINRSHVYLKIDGVATSGFTWVNDGAITISPAPADGANVLVYRDTPKDARLVDFSNESHLSAHNLDLSAEQIFYINQEEFDWARRGMDFIDDAQAAAVTAQEYAGYAGEASLRAETLEANAELFMTRAETASNLAELAKGLAIEAKDAAIIAKTGAEDARDTAVGYLNSTEEAKDGALLAKDGAVSALSEALDALALCEGYADNVNSKISQVEANITLTLGYKNAAEIAKDGAVEAKNQTLAVVGGAEAAQIAAETARDSALSAKTASESARDASILARTASESARDASISAKEAALLAKSGAEDAIEDALLAKTGAEVAKDAALLAKSGAEIAEAKAEKWANEAEDVEVETGLYSARHWAEKAKDNSGGGVSSWNDLTDKPSTFPPETHNHDALYAALAHNHTGVYAPASHTHSIANITNLQTTLDAKAASTHTHPYLTAISNDTAPSLGGPLDCNTKALLFSVYTIPGTEINVANGQYQQKTLSANIVVTLPAPASSKLTSFHLLITQGSTARTITWPSNVIWESGVAPDLTTANGLYRLHFTYDGTYWNGGWGRFYV